MTGVFLIFAMIVGMVVSAVQKHRADESGEETEIAETEIVQEEEPEEVEEPAEEKKGLFSFFHREKEDEEIHPLFYLNAAGN